MIYTDEGYRVMHGIYMPPWMEACTTAGRQRGIGMITCTQRPKRVDQRLISESEHLICFRLRLKSDRERMAEQMGDKVVTHPAREHSFWYLRDGEDEPRYYNLEL